MEYSEMFDIASENVKAKDWGIAQTLIEELKYPFKDSREDRVHLQLKGIAFILKLFDEGKKAILLRGGTGLGKSVINVTLANNMEGKSFLTTAQKKLQDQYYGDFSELCEIIKGRNNYKCRKGNYSCAEGDCRKIGKSKCKEYINCDYWRQKIAASEAKLCIMNFSYFCLENSDMFNKRELLVIDEADDISESAILSQCEVILSHRTLYGIYDYIDFKKDEFEVLDYAKELLEDEIGELKDKDMFTFTDIKLLEAYKDLAYRIDRVNDEWISQRSETFVKARHSSLRPGVYPRVTFKPLSIAPFAYDMIWKRADKYVMSSATMNRDVFKKENGLDTFLDDDEISFVNFPDLFNAPIYDVSKHVGKMSNKFFSDNLPKAIGAIETLSENYLDKRGLILTTSFAKVKSIENMVRGTDLGDRMVYHLSDTNRDELMDSMMNESLEKDAIVVSPSLWRGADLRDDRCRHIYMLNAPYKNILDARMKIRSKDFMWYQWLAAAELVQGCGRGMRSLEDSCDVFWLDSGLGNIIKRTSKRNVSNEFLQSIDWNGCEKFL